MPEVADAAADIEYGGRAHPLFHLLAPIVAAGAVWAARTGIGITYERITGRKRPIPSDLETTWRRAIGWTALTTTTAAVIEVTVRRTANKRRVRRILKRGGTVSLGPGWRVGEARSGQELPAFVSESLKELADERSAARKAMEAGD